MPDEEDSTKQNANHADLQLVTNLIFYHRIRNAAEGITADTRFISGLIEYGVWLQNEEAKRITQAAFYQGIIDNARERTAALLEYADTADKRREILPEVIRLNNEAVKAERALEAMAGR